MSESTNHIDYEKIASYLANELDLEGRKDIDQWIAASPDNKKYFDTCKSIFEKTEENTNNSDIQFDVDSAWKKVSQIIDTPKEETRTINWNVYYISGIAASLLLIMLWVFNPFSSGKIEYRAESEILEIFLPDSSKAVIDIGSSISYNENFGIDNRDIEMQGKVYYDVVKNEQLPFEITSSNSVVNVLGTAFLVEDLKQFTEVTVERGLVSVGILDDTTSLLVKPNFLVTIDRESKNTTSEELTSLNHLYWANHKLIYKQETLNTVFEELSKIFQKEFNYDKSTADNCQISGIFRDQTLQSLLKNIALSVEFEFIITDKSVQIKSIYCDN